MLESLGCRVETAAGGREAVALASARDFAAVLMDCRMPGMDGIQATAAIRSLPGRRGRVPIIAVTGLDNAEERRRCLEAGMDDFLNKPLRKSALAEVLSRLTGPARKPGPFPAPDAPADAGKGIGSAAGASSQEEEEGVATGMPAEAPVASGEEGPFILEHLEKAVSGFGAGNPRFIPELVKLFLKGLPDTLAGLEAAVADGDRSRIERSAHALHGAAAQMGAKRLARLCRNLEDAAVGGVESGVPDMLSQIKVEFARVSAELRRYPGI
jgi:CheY-like chemotaxis protein/HPt (histidine-containing phosphotransfer) domain-containing protein